MCVSVCARCFHSLWNRTRSVGVTTVGPSTSWGGSAGIRTCVICDCCHFVSGSSIPDFCCLCLVGLGCRPPWRQLVSPLWTSWRLQNDASPSPAPQARGFGGGSHHRHEHGSSDCSVRFGTHDEKSRAQCPPTGYSLADPAEREIALDVTEKLRFIDCGD